MSARKGPRPFIYLATPCYGGMLNLLFMRSVLDLQAACQARDIGLHVELMGGEALITRGRSRLAAQFLAHGRATHLFFCDADIGFLCCIYRCDATNPPTYKSYCIEGAERGKTRCNSSLEGCSFNEANYRESCAACTALP